MSSVRRADLVGYPESAGGVLTSGGSVAILTAILAARDVRGVAPADIPSLVVYATEELHYAAAKALHIAGLREAIHRRVPVDALRRLVPDELARLVAEDRANGLSPWLVLSTLGTVNSGAIDPLDAIGAIARAEGLWHHVDAAYGGFYMLVDAFRPRFRGIEQSDSVVLDPHKSLFVPYGAGAIVVRDAGHLDALRCSAPYLLESEMANPSPSEQSIELTKHFRGLRMLFSTMCFRRSRPGVQRTRQTRRHLTCTMRSTPTDRSLSPAVGCTGTSGSAPVSKCSVLTPSMSTL